MWLAAPFLAAAVVVVVVVVEQPACSSQSHFAVFGAPVAALGAFCPVCGWTLRVLSRGRLAFWRSLLRLTHHDHFDLLSSKQGLASLALPPQRAYSLALSIDS
jgi:hypothetical protein